MCLHVFAVACSGSAMCTRPINRGLLPDCKNDANFMDRNYKNLPKPRVRCRKTCRSLEDELADCENRRGLCHSSFQGDNSLTQSGITCIDKIDDWDDPRDPYNYTTTGYLLVRRRSMLSSPLLVKHQIGTPFQCCRKLPCSDFTYGSLSTESPSAGLALRGWAGDIKDVKTCTSFAKGSANWTSDWSTAYRYTNFMALNRAAVTAGVTGHDDWRDFRNTHRIKFSRHEAAENDRRPPPLALNSDATFGKPTTYNSTATEIMSGQEQLDWRRFVKDCSLQQPLKKKIDPWKENRASTLRMFKKPTGLKPDIPWHLPKFESKAKPHLWTFRKPTECLDAHKANNYEKVGRDGMFGQGIPTKAVNKADGLCCYKP